MLDDRSERLARARNRYAQRRPKSRELFERASVVLPAGSTRSVLDVNPLPFSVAQAEGARLIDVDGNEYIDFLGDYSAGLLGHDPSPVAAAVRGALERGWSYGGVHVDEIRFAQAVCDRFPSIEQVRFTNSGTEANLMAIQLARHHTGRDTIVVVDAAYHGGLLYFGRGGEALLAPFDFRRIRYNDVDALPDAIDDTVAAVLVEPMMGSAGCIPATSAFLGALRSRCDAAGALLIFDEVMTSRMSVGGVQLRHGVTPDLTTLGKYLAGGMTFGAFGGRADVMAAFDPARGGTLTHGGTFNNNVITMAAGCAGLTEVFTAEVAETLFARGEALRARLNDAGREAGVPFQATGVGSIMALHPQSEPIRRTADLVVPLPLRKLVHLEMLTRGYSFARRGYVTLSLPLEDADLDGFVAALTDMLASVVAPLLARAPAKAQRARG